MSEGRDRFIVAAVVLAVAGGSAYWYYAVKQKREQQQALVAPPAPEILSRIDGNLKAAKAPRDAVLADAAGGYIQDAREIVRRRADAERLAREAAMSRRALAMHMAAASARDSYWIRIATDLKKRVERDHYELDLSLRVLSDLLFNLPEAQKRLAPHIDAALLLEDGERVKARERAMEASKHAAAELEKVRKLAQPR